jgi:predicted acyltransferase
MTTQPERLASLDALRGFNMFWIVGGEHLIRNLATCTGWPVLRWGATQTHHAGWTGFTFYDLVFALFLFLAGVAMPYSLGRQSEKGVPRRTTYRRLAQRAVLLILLGTVYNGLLQFKGIDQTRLCSVLGYIGAAYFLAALIYLHTTVRHQVIWVIGILLGYWAALTLVPIPGYGAGNLTMGGNMASFINRHLVPGLYNHPGVHDSQGPFLVIPAICNVLCGAVAGHFVRNVTLSKKRKGFVLLGAGLACLLLAKLWGLTFVIGKELWTSSFVVHCVGWSLLLFGVFYLVIDVLGLKKWAFFFAVIGMNPITIYIGVKAVNFHHTSHFFSVVH